MSDRDDIKATAEDLIDDAERLRQIEAQKLALEPGDPAQVRLAREAEGIVARMKSKAMAQTEIVANGDNA